LIIMKIKIKSIVTIGLGLIVLLITIQGCSKHANYPVTRLAGWAPLENIQWEVLELSARFAGQNFSLYNSTTELLIRAKLKVQGRGRVSYNLNKLHISQRTIREDPQKIMGIKITAPGFPPKADSLYIKQYLEEHQTDTLPFTLIEITPVYEVDRQALKAETREFHLVIEEPIQNRARGRNYYRIILGDQTLDLGTFQ